MKSNREKEKSQPTGKVAKTSGVNNTATSNSTNSNIAGHSNLQNNPTTISIPIPNVKIPDAGIDTHKLKESMNNGKSNILVCVRCRPLTKKEIDVSNIETVKILNKKIVIVLDPIEYNGHEEVFKNRSREQQYAFDYVFDNHSTQQEVYENSSKFLIPGITQGFNATVFAYGATGAGKTHTMLGTGREPGMMVRSLGDLFSTIEASTQRQFKVKISYVEVYNETLRDLLGNSGDNLDLREDPTKGSVIVGVKELEVNTSTQVFELLLKGNKSRTTESTNMNETSSRSHAVLQILVENKAGNSEKNESVISKFILVDLAGSERAANTKNTGMRLIEGASINKSLLSLGNCINALVEISNGSSKTFIPWRDSKLTRLLKDSLGGNSRIVMIANISPSVFTLEDTLNTLKYANRAKNIKTNVKRNVLDVDFHINKYDEVISHLKSELENLRHNLAVKTHNSHLLSM
jgi:kinesin family protein 18/19